MLAQRAQPERRGAGATLRLLRNVPGTTALARRCCRLSRLVPRLQALRMVSFFGDKEQTLTLFAPTGELPGERRAAAHSRMHLLSPALSLLRPPPADAAFAAALKALKLTPKQLFADKELLRKVWGAGGEGGFLALRTAVPCR